MPLPSVRIQDRNNQCFTTTERITSKGQNLDELINLNEMINLDEMINMDEMINLNGDQSGIRDLMTSSITNNHSQ